MSFAYTRLADTQYISDSAAAIVTNAVGKKTYIKTITIHNTHSAAIAVTLYRVPDSTGSVGTASAANQVWKQTVGIEETVILEFFPPGWVLSDTNDTIQAVAGTASKVTISVDGGLE